MMVQGLRIWFESVSLSLELIQKTWILRKRVALSEVMTLFFESMVRVMRGCLSLVVHFIHLFADTFETFLKFFKLITIIWELSVDKIEHKFFKFSHFLTQIVESFIFYLRTSLVRLSLTVRDALKVFFHYSLTSSDSIPHLAAYHLVHFIYSEDNVFVSTIIHPNFFIKFFYTGP